MDGIIIDKVKVSNIRPTIYNENGKCRKTGNDVMDDMEVLEMLCRPIIKFIRNKGPYLSVIIDENEIKVKQDTMSIKINQ